MPAVLNVVLLLAGPHSLHPACQAAAYRREARRVQAEEDATQQPHSRQQRLELLQVGASGSSGQQRSQLLHGLKGNRRKRILRAAATAAGYSMHTHVATKPFTQLTAGQQPADAGYMICQGFKGHS